MVVGEVGNTYASGLVAERGVGDGAHQLTLDKGIADAISEGSEYLWFDELGGGIDHPVKVGSLNGADCTVVNLDVVYNLGGIVVGLSLIVVPIRSRIRKIRVTRLAFPVDEVLVLGTIGYCEDIGK